MGPGRRLDTNVLIDYLAGRLPAPAASRLEAIFQHETYSISIITRLEVLSFQAPPPVLQDTLLLLSYAQELGLSEAIVQQTIAIRQHKRLKLPDAIIAATALAHGLPLLTRNGSDFNAIPGLTVLDPHHAAHLPYL